jgi:GNAT superfamily N-acetyltransferase
MSEAARREEPAVTATGDAERRLREVFLAARLRWQAVPAARAVDGDLETAWARLEDQLEKPENAALRRQVLAGAAGATGPGDGAAEADDPLPALPLVREALRLMEAVYFRLPLAGTAGAAAHRRSLPWLNRFGRWTGAATFRRWWPWLVPLHAPELVAYLRRALALPAFPGRGTVRVLDPSRDAEGYALRRWRCEEPPDAGPAAAAATRQAQTSLFGFFLRFETPWHDLNAAIAVVDWDPEVPYVASWRAQDLYVPPGLWGTGIGEAFLELLLGKLFEDGCRLVQVEAPPASQGGAHWHTLYSGAHFLRRTEEGAAGERRTWFERPLTRDDTPADPSA